MHSFGLNLVNLKCGTFQSHIIVYGSPILDLTYPLARSQRVRAVWKFAVQMVWTVSKSTLKKTLKNLFPLIAAGALFRSGQGDFVDHWLESGCDGGCQCLRQVSGTFFHILALAFDGLCHQVRSLRQSFQYEHDGRFLARPFLKALCAHVHCWKQGTVASIERL